MISQAAVRIVYLSKAPRTPPLSLVSSPRVGAQGDWNNYHLSDSAISLWGSEIIAVMIIITIPISQIKKWRPRELKFFQHFPLEFSPA